MEELLFGVLWFVPTYVYGKRWTSSGRHPGLAYGLALALFAFPAGIISAFVSVISGYSS